MGLDSQPILFSAGSSASASSKRKEKAPPPVALDPNQSDEELDEWFDKLSIEDNPSARPH